MSQSEPPSFHVRFFPGLKEKLEGARGSRSLNKEINDRLERSFESDAFTRIAEIFRPLLAGMSEADQADLVEAISAAVQMLAKNPAKRRSQK